MAELAESIKKHGILQPILVRTIVSKVGSPNIIGYEIVCGERRFRAAKDAGLKEIPVAIKKLTDTEVVEIQVVENLQRSDLHALEEADGYRQLMKVKYDAARIAERVGRSVKYVYDRIKLLNLIEPLQKEFREDKITAGHAILLARLTPDEQKKVSQKDSGGLWTDEDAQFESIVGKSDGYKLQSVRELQQYIDEHVRFVPDRDADPMLFPATAEILKAADPKKKSDKIVAITYGYVQPAARNGQHHIAPTSWKRADGKKGSKVCDFSVIGVVVAGEERAEAFRVCVNKEKCKIHWGQWQKERAARNRTRCTGGLIASPKSQEESYAVREARERKQSEKNQKIGEAVLAEALPQVLKFANKMSCEEALRFIVRDGIRSNNVDECVHDRHGVKSDKALIEKVEKADAPLLSELAISILIENPFSSYRAEWDSTFEDICSVAKIDLKALQQKHAGLIGREIKEAEQASKKTGADVCTKSVSKEKRAKLPKK